MKTIKLGSTGKEVECLQECLVKAGYAVGEKGLLDATTHHSLMAFQKANGLKPDGIVGYLTWETLFLHDKPLTEGPLSEKHFKLVAQLLDCEPEALQAVQMVETGGRGGFFAPALPAILFEGHVFWRQLEKRGIDPTKLVRGNENILYPKWSKGHYVGGKDEYNRLAKARAINKEAADCSASWGMFQVMGFNFAQCGEPDVATFVADMKKSECMQLVLAARFIRKSGMLPALQAKNWAEFAKRYNGPQYAQNNYDKKLQAAYMAKKWHS